MQPEPDSMHHQIGSEKRSQNLNYQDLLLNNSFCVWIEKTTKKAFLWVLDG
jgi:hypothetical protein